MPVFSGPEGSSSVLLAKFDEFTASSARWASSWWASPCRPGRPGSSSWKTA
jgi:hypothetical protein